MEHSVEFEKESVKTAYCSSVFKSKDASERKQAYTCLWIKLINQMERRKA